MFTYWAWAHREKNQIATPTIHVHGDRTTRTAYCPTLATVAQPNGSRAGRVTGASAGKISA
ncbi:hypothetical protein Acsp01_20070 [Actinoplanes sp. NBRC 101535]|nr:hypothetical protein Acsp01_20070 [Actinoplanes sp. NBRC 101535]